MNITFVAIQHSLWFRGLKDNATVRYERVFSSTIPHFFYRYYEILPTCCWWKVRETHTPYSTILKNSPKIIYILSRHLNKLCYPGKSQFLTDAFAKATKNPYSFLFLDWHVNTPDEWRVRSSIFPVLSSSLLQTVFVLKYAFRTKIFSHSFRSEPTIHNFIFCLLWDVAFQSS